jgi:cell division protein FtsN
MMKLSQRGGLVLGFVLGLLIGLAMALAVALYITKAPVPFLNKVPQRTAEQDNAETERNKNWDPNAPLAGKAGVRAAAAASAASATAASASAAVAGRSPPPAIAASAARVTAALPGAASSTAAGPEAFMYFVQAGAYTRSEEAEQQRAKLALLGMAAKVTEREQAGRTVFRVRVGPYETREEADGVQAKLTEASVEARLVRVDRP